MDFGFEDGTIKLAFSSAFWQLANNDKDREKLKYKPHSLLGHKTGEWLPEAVETRQATYERKWTMPWLQSLEPAGDAS